MKASTEATVRRLIHCTFCFRDDQTATCLIASTLPSGFTVYICDGCVDLCTKIVADDRAAKEKANEPAKE